MAEGDLAEALRRLMERGWRTGDPTRGDMAGLRDLLDRLERRREELLERYELGDVLGDIRRELDEIVAEERAGVERRLDEAAGAPRRRDGDRTTRPTDRARACARCSATSPPSGSTSSTRLPPDVGERIRGLQDYDFLEPDARERFDELVKRLQQQVLDQFVAGMSEAIRSMTPGGPRREPRDGPRPQRADPRADRRRRPGRAASSWPSTAGSSRAPGPSTTSSTSSPSGWPRCSRCMRSMSPEQRAELQSMMEALLRDDRLLIDLAQLASNLDLLLPGGLGERVPFGGDEPLGLDGALAQIGRLQAMDRLEDALADVESPGRPRRRSIATRCATCSATTRSATSTRSTTSRGGSRRPAT